MTLFRTLALCAVSALSLAACGSGNDASGSTGSGGSAGSTAGSGGSSGSTATGGASGGGASGASGGTGGASGSGGASGTAGTAGSSFKPYFFDNFESYTDGDSLSNNQPFDAAGHTHASSEQAHRGKQSAKMEIHAGDAGGFGKWGGIIPIKPVLGKGQEVWVRLWVM